MEEAAPTHEGTEAPEHKGGFPPFDTTTFPSQLFWLAITFTFLFVVLWRVAGPRINAAITLRRNTINAAIEAATRARGDADTALAEYQTALAGARARANAVAEETRQKMNAEIAKAKAEADATATAAMHAADARIQAARSAAKVHVANAARDAAIVIVQRLTGESVSPEDAAKAVGG